jgi:hypothetical protein
VAGFNFWSYGVAVASGQPKRYFRNMSDEKEKMSLEISGHVALVLE